MGIKVEEFEGDAGGGGTSQMRKDRKIRLPCGKKMVRLLVYSTCLIKQGGK